MNNRNVAFTVVGLVLVIGGIIFGVTLGPELLSNCEDGGVITVEHVEPTADDPPVQPPDNVTVPNATEALEEEFLRDLVAEAAENGSVNMTATCHQSAAAKDDLPVPNDNYYQGGWYFEYDGEMVKLYWYVNL